MPEKKKKQTITEIFAARQKKDKKPPLQHSSTTMNSLSIEQGEHGSSDKDKEVWRRAQAMETKARKRGLRVTGANNAVEIYRRYRERTSK